MDIDDVSGVVIEAALEVHSAFGPGLLESLYERALKHEIESRGLESARQVPVEVFYRGARVGPAFRADLIVAGLVLVEIKSTQAECAAHRKQVLTYLRLAGLEVGLLLNFGRPHLRQGITRLVNRYRGTRF
jgi:GxxExxY protein